MRWIAAGATEAIHGGCIGPLKILLQMAHQMDDIARPRERTLARRNTDSSRQRDWVDLTDQDLLDVQISKLAVRVVGSPLEERVDRLGDELNRSGLIFRPSVWLSTDWFSPHGVPGFAIPFVLAHPRLVRLERKQMLDCEGAPRGWCMQLLRHETGHALDTAYRLHWRKDWRRVFGRASVAYRQTYIPKPGSKHHVHNLDDWYAQSHPIEDFAETFAVWLRTRGRWRSQYQGWPALRKLEYVDGLMQEIAKAPKKVQSREKPDSLVTVHMTLREYYQRKKDHYGEEDRSIYDRDLKRLFTTQKGGRLASAFLRERRLELRRAVSRWTSQRPFVVDEVLRGMIHRCRELGLRLHHTERETGEGAAILVTLHTARVQRMRHREYFR